MKCYLLLVMLVAALMLASACSGDTTPTATVTPEPTPVATPQPSPSPTPEPKGLISYESQELGVRFEHPEEWEATQTDEQEEWLILAGDDGEPRVRLLVRFHEADDPLDERIESFIEELTDEDEGAEVERGGPVTLDNGSAAERAEIVRDVDGTSVL